MSPGDTITMRSGTYAGNVSITKPDLTLRNYPGETPQITARSDRRAIQVSIRVDYDANNTKLIGLDISGGYYYALKTETTWATGAPDEHGPSGLLVQNCKLHDSGSDVIKLTPRTSNGAIIGSEIYNSGLVDTTASEGIDAVQANYFTVADNYIHNTRNNGVYFKGGSIGTVIERNRITATGYSGILLGQDTDPEWFDTTINPNYYESIDGIVRNNVISNTAGAGIGAWAALRPQIYNNTLYNVAQTMFGGLLIQAQEHWIPDSVYRPSTDVTMYNNIVYVTSTLPVLEIRDNGLTGSLTLSNNLYYSSRGPVLIRDFTRGFTGSLTAWQLLGLDTGSKEAAPMLDTANGFRLTSQSPAIDAGKTSPVATDYLNNPRPSGSGYDIGAYEYQSGYLLPPTGFSGVSMSRSLVALYWTVKAPTYAQEMEIATDASFTLDVVRVQIPAAAATYLWPGLLANVPYHFRIRARDAQATSAWTESQVRTSFVPFVPNAPAAPLIAASTTAVQLTWAAPPNTMDNPATAYILERSASPAFTTQLRRQTLASLSYSDTEVQPDTRYYYRLIATNAQGWSNVSAIAEAFTGIAANQAPVVVRPPFASPSIVTNLTANLSILGGDDGGESSLSYTWSTVTSPAGVAAPVFSLNASNAARNTTVRFTSIGRYTLQCTITDAEGVSTAALLEIQVVAPAVAPLSGTPLHSGGHQSALARLLPTSA